jgi:hypothetical protein
VLFDRGVDVQIAYHDTKKDDDPNRAAIAGPKSLSGMFLHI